MVDIPRLRKNHGWMETVWCLSSRYSGYTGKALTDSGRYAYQFSPF